jgi:uncharacterized protein YhbP (UPF0306 family)
MNLRFLSFILSVFPFSKSNKMFFTAPYALLNFLSMQVTIMDAIKTKIAAYLASHPYLRLGTVTAHSTPQVHTVGYVPEACIIYFVTDRKSRKAENISKNPAGAFTVDENYEDVMTIQGIQMEGTASRITLETEAVRILGLMAKKFPGMEEMGPNPDLVIFKIEPTRGYFLDNTVAFGHRDMVEFL